MITRVGMSPNNNTRTNFKARFAKEATDIVGREYDHLSRMKDFSLDTIANLNEHAGTDHITIHLNNNHLTAKSPEPNHLSYVYSVYIQTNKYPGIESLRLLPSDLHPGLDNGKNPFRTLSHIFGSSSKEYNTSTFTPAFLENFEETVIKTASKSSRIIKKLLNGKTAKTKLDEQSRNILGRLLTPHTRVTPQHVQGLTNILKAPEHLNYKFELDGDNIKLIYSSHKYPKIESLSTEIKDSKSGSDLIDILATRADYNAITNDEVSLKHFHEKAMIAEAEATEIAQTKGPYMASLRREN